MSRDNKRKYLSAYIPEVKPKETPKRDGMKSDGRYAEIEAAVAALNDMIAKQNRDNLDAMYNIDMDNMSSSMRRLFQSYDDGITKANTEIKAWADEMEAGFSAVAQWQKTVEDGTISSIASVNAKADANGASISQFAQWQKTADEEIDGLVNTTAVIKAESDANGASIEQIVTAVGEDGEVTAASIAAAVSEDESFIKLIADRVEVQGTAYFTSLGDEGITTVDGNDIAMISGYDVESISKLTFYKKYTDEAGDEALAQMFRIRTIDNSKSTDIQARYAAILETGFFVEDGEFYLPALKFAAGGMSFDTTSAYFKASQYLTMNAEYGTRIVAEKTYHESVGASGAYPLANNTYIFCSTGIFYCDHEGGVTQVVSVI